MELGQQVEFQTEAYPGKMFTGRVVYIDPLVNEKTRTVRVRLEVPNKDGSLKPGMLVRATQHKDGEHKEDADSPLVIPASAPLITGKRAVVYVANPDKEGAFVGREVVLGAKAGNHYKVKSGLEEGELVVTKGNFKIDSAIQIVAKPSMMNPTTAAGAIEEELPSLFTSKLKLLMQSFTELTAAVKTNDLQKTHLAFGKFNKELRQIDGSDLEGKAALRWKEYAMLLGNDAILGAEAPNTKRLQEIFREMQGHFAGLVAAFKLDVATEQYDVPEAFKQQLGLVFAEYEQLSEALAADKAEAARKAAAKVSGALQLVNASDLDGPSHNVWTENLSKMTDGLAAIREAEDIVGIRTGFEPLSVGLSTVILKLGAETEGPLFEIFCPMAFEFEGATWLQRDEEVRNPYFGAAMHSCGETKQQLKK